jgi:hypothetical protein
MHLTAANVNAFDNFVPPPGNQTGGSPTITQNAVALLQIRI